MSCCLNEARALPQGGAAGPQRWAAALAPVVQRRRPATARRSRARRSAAAAVWAAPATAPPPPAEQEMRRRFRRQRMINKMHVIHARWAGCHARQTRQAPINMLDGFRIGGSTRLQHILDQVNPPARTIQFVTQHLVRWASGGAKPAMHAGAQHFVGPRRCRIKQLFGGKICLHIRRQAF